MGRDDEKKKNEEKERRISYDKHQMKSDSSSWCMHTSNIQQRKHTTHLIGDVYLFPTIFAQSSSYFFVCTPCTVYIVDHCGYIYGGGVTNMAGQHAAQME